MAEVRLDAPENDLTQSRLSRGDRRECSRVDEVADRRDDLAR
jgi:hypothetical protein